MQAISCYLEEIGLDWLYWGFDLQEIRKDGGDKYYLQLQYYDPLYYKKNFL